MAGRELDAAPADPDAVVTLAKLTNAFLHYKKQMLDCGELSPRTWQGYEAVGKMLVDFFDRNIAAERLGQDDFQRLRAHLASKHGPVALGNRMQVVRMIFRYGYDSERLKTPAKFGVEFNKPSAKTLRLAQLPSRKDRRAATHSPLARDGRCGSQGDRGSTAGKEARRVASALHWYAWYELREPHRRRSAACPQR